MYNVYYDIYGFHSKGKCNKITNRKQTFHFGRSFTRENLDHRWHATFPVHSFRKATQANEYVERREGRGRKLASTQIKQRYAMAIRSSRFCINRAATRTPPALNQGRNIRKRRTPDTVGCRDCNGSCWPCHIVVAAATTRTWAINIAAMIAVLICFKIIGIIMDIITTIVGGFTVTSTLSHHSLGSYTSAVDRTTGHTYVRWIERRRR